MTVDGWLQASYWRVRERGRLRPYVDSQSTNSYLRRQRLRTIHVLRVEPLRTGRGVHAALRSVEHHRPQSINQRIHSLMETDFAHDVVIRRNAPHSIQIGCCVPRAVPPSGHIFIRFPRTSQHPTASHAEFELATSIRFGDSTEFQKWRPWFYDYVTQWQKYR